MPLGGPVVLPVDPYEQYGLDFSQLTSDFAALVAFPFKQTDKTSGWFYVPDARNFLSDTDDTWGRSTGASSVESQYTKASFIAQAYGMQEPVTDIDAKDWMSGPADLGTQTMEQLVQRWALKFEIRAEAAIDAATFGTSAAGNVWDGTSANPRLNVRAASTAVRKKIGRGANKMILPGAVVDVLCGSTLANTGGAQILEAIKYTREAGGNALTEALFAGYFNLDQVKFAMAVTSGALLTTTIGVGLATAGTYVWDQKEAYVFYNGTPGAKAPNFGTTFGPDLATPDDFYEEQIKGRFYRITSTYQQNMVCSASMNVITGAIT